MSSPGASRLPLDLCDREGSGHEILISFGSSGPWLGCQYGQVATPIVDRDGDR